jgi:hypothetical protein
MMLAVRRPGGYEDTAQPRKAEAHPYRQRREHYANREGLERAAGNKYGTPEAELERLIPS